MNRREFMKSTALAGGGIAFGFYWGEGLASSLWAADSSTAAGGAFEPNAWIRITPSNQVIFVLDKTEMGQSVTTSLAMILCEELEYDPTQLVIEHAPAGEVYKTPGFGLQITGGSASVRSSFEILSKAGATAREVLINAAARQWSVKKSDLLVSAGRIRTKDGSKDGAFGDFATAAVHEKIPEKVALKSPQDYKLVGRSQKRLDGRAKVTGKAGFGIDAAPEGVKLYSAYVLRAPMLGGKIDSFDASAAEKIPGVLKIVGISSGVAVVAESFWIAKQAAGKIQAKWTQGEGLKGLSTEKIFAEFRSALKKDGKAFTDIGDVDKAIAAAADVIEAEYEIPYMAHATMEPMNGAAYVQKDRCDVWAPTQGPGLAQVFAAEITGLAHENVHIHQTLIGGGFGRRLAQDYVVDAVEISKATGLPVKVIMAREDDMKNDVYRPANLHQLQASFDSKKNLLSWRHKVAGPSIMAQLVPQWAHAMVPEWVPVAVRNLIGSAGGNFIGWLDQDETSVEGAHDMAYAIENKKVSYVHHDPGVPVGFWRSVGHSFTGFVVESFIDECAHKAGDDPYEFRHRLLKDAKQRRKVLELVAEKSRWKDRTKDGRSLGIAQTLSFGSYAAQVAEVEVKGQEIIVKKITCAFDCGLVVNPDQVVAQIESSIIFALSAALKDPITIKDGEIQQSNFHDYQVLRMQETPEIEVHLVEGSSKPQGAGEPAVPPLAAAVANAIFAATGKRVRKLPLRLEA